MEARDLKRFLWVNVLNLPEREAKDKLTKGRAKKATVAAKRADDDGLSDWSTASVEARQEQRGSTAAQSPWTPIETSRKQSLWAYLVRGLLVVVLLFTLATGVRAMIWPNGFNDQTETIPATLNYPTVAGQGVAERFAAAYLAWDPEQVEQRTETLNRDYAGGGAGPAGWNEKGKQDVRDLHTVAVDVESDTLARFTVAGTVTPYTGEPDKLKKGEPHPSAVEIKVQVIEGRPVVVSRPGAVAVPAPPQVPPVEAPAEDSPLAKSTEDYAESFFREYAEGTDLSALIAPDASITGLGGNGIEFKALDTWQVFAGGPDSREAEAVVTWTQAGAELSQPYSLTLTRVTSSSGERWQISSLSGGEH